MLKFKPLTKKEQKRLYELEEKAVNAFLEDANFDADEWLDGEDKKEFNQLSNRIHGYEIYP